MSEVTAFITLVFIFVAFRWYTLSSKKTKRASVVQEWHHLAPISQRYQTVGSHTSFLYFIKEAGIQQIK